MTSSLGKQVPDHLPDVTVTRLSNFGNFKAIDELFFEVHTDMYKTHEKILRTSSDRVH
ncbi:hypothetical protein J6590_050477 [Homalodisca vitripennis]|nr:hypothetical protein J6590_050477 [Homalodisca vitripennis]